jgi:hypothetical protein
MKGMRLLSLSLILARAMFADMYEVVKYTIAGKESVSANYTQGRNVRSESGTGIRIFIADTQTTLILDPARKQYMELKGRPALLFTLAQWIARPRESGKTVHIYYETNDGWYIDLPGERRTRAEVRALGDRPCHDQVIRHGEPAWPGFAMLSVRGEMKREVLEFSAAPLDPKLFEAPADYKRTDPPTTSWIQDLNWQWPMLQRAIETWLE